MASIGALMHMLSDYHVTTGCRCWKKHMKNDERRVSLTDALFCPVAVNDVRCIIRLDSISEQPLAGSPLLIDIFSNVSLTDVQMNIQNPNDYISKSMTSDEFLTTSAQHRTTHLIVLINRML
jgi:hypothetical protein